MNKFKKGDRVQEVTPLRGTEERRIGTFERYTYDDFSEATVYWDDQDNYPHEYTIETDDLELLNPHQTPIDWPVPDWFTWGMKHKCWVWDDDKTNGHEADVYCIDFDDYCFRVIDEDGDNFYYKNAEPITEEPPKLSVIDRILEDTDFGCRKDDVKKVMERLLKELKGDKENP